MKLSNIKKWIKMNSDNTDFQVVGTEAEASHYLSLTMSNNLIFSLSVSPVETPKEMWINKMVNEFGYDRDAMFSDAVIKILSQSYDDLKGEYATGAADTAPKISPEGYFAQSHLDTKDDALEEDEDGWIKWNGDYDKPLHLSLDTLVRYKLSGGCESTDAVRDLIWDYDNPRLIKGGLGYIIAYKVEE